MTVEIVTSKAIGIQILRHRSFTFQEFSQRYAKVTEIEPIEFRKQAEKNRQSSTDVIGSVDIHSDKDVDIFNKNDFCMSDVAILGKVADYLKEGQKLYNELLDYGIAKECARMVLPMATKTTIYMTGSIRSWIHFIEIRENAHAQKEAQILAKEIREIFMEQMPLISEARGYNFIGF